MKITKPIFILGSGRSGTTILYHLLAMHPDVYWFSNITNSHPDHSELAIMNRLIDVPIVGKCIKKSMIQTPTTSLLYPSEGEKIYSYYNFKDNQQTLSPTDNLSEDAFKKSIALQLFLTGKKRFLSKRTANTQRLAVIQTLFPDAFYIHIIRDGRAVAYSLLQTPWWKHLPIWWLTGKTPHEWVQKGDDPIRLCALHWQHNVEEIRKQNKHIAPRYLELRYEDIVTDVPGLLKRILTFCMLPFSNTYLYDLPKTLPNMNYKWKNKLTDHQKNILLDTIGPFVRHLGYK